jgi:hypothetical protein
MYTLLPKLFVVHIYLIHSQHVNIYLISYVGDLTPSLQLSPNFQNQPKNVV